MLRRAWVGCLLLTIATLMTGYACEAQISITVAFAPPELPVYEQPPCPGEDYIWTPGYWAWDGDEDDYYWVPGTWVLAPEPGYFWTPPYWAWEPSGYYVFYPGYWGPQIGFYGGIDYGYGYFGHGYEGGRWKHGHFFYNREVNNVNVTVVHNVYNTRVEERNVNVARVSYNGGNGGVSARPTAEELNVSRERHVAATPSQTQHYQAARSNTQFRASVNHGRPPVAATEKPAEFSGRNVVAARSGGNYTPPPNRGHNGGPPAGNAHNGAGSPPANANRPPNAPSHARELPPLERPTTPNTGNPKLDQKYAQQQQKLYEKQNQDRQKLQQQQEKEHQKFAQQQANQARQQQQTAQRQQQQQETERRQQQMEQRHQQQTQQMMQRHAQEQQKLQQRQAPPTAHTNPPPHQEPHH